MRFKKLGLLVLLAVSGLLYPMAYAANADDDALDDSTVTVPARPKNAIGNMLLQSMSLIGIPYRWGGNSPETGMDCSGFIRYLYKTSLGINLPRTSAEMAKLGKKISIDKMEPGDLIFFNTRRGANTHVGMYLGNNKMIVAPRTGQDIQITELDSSFRSRFNGAKRIVQENEDDDGNTTLQSFQEIRDEALPGGGHSKRYSSRHSTNGKHHHRKRHGSSKKTSKVKTKAAHKKRANVKKKAT